MAGVTMRAAVAFCGLLGLAGSAGAQTVSRADMEKAIVAGMYRYSCEQAKAQGQPVVVEVCAVSLVKSRGPAFTERLRGYSDDQVRTLYLRYGPKP